MIIICIVLVLVVGTQAGNSLSLSTTRVQWRELVPAGVSRVLLEDSTSTTLVSAYGPGLWADDSQEESHRDAGHRRRCICHYLPPFWTFPSRSTVL